MESQAIAMNLRTTWNACTDSYLITPLTNKYCPRQKDIYSVHSKGRHSREFVSIHLLNPGVIQLRNDRRHQNNTTP